MTPENNSNPHINKYKLRIQKLNELYSFFKHVEPDNFETVAAALTTHQTADWISFGFHCIQKGDSNVLPFLISSRRVPLLARNKNGSTFLHAAISSNNFSIASYLVKSDNFAIMFKWINKSGKTALDIAVNQNFYVYLPLLLSDDHNGSMDTIMKKIVKRTIRKSDGYCQEVLRLSLRLTDIWHCHFDFDSRKKEITSLDWWSTRKNDWSKMELRLIGIYLRMDGRKGLLVSFKWYVEVWGIWKSMTIADAVAVGSLSDSDFFESFADDEEEGYSSHSKKIDFFNLLVVHRWNGDSNSLAEFLATVGADAKDNKWITSFQQKHSEERLEVLKYMAKFYETNGSIVFPRLDVVVICRQYDILKWMIESSLVDVNFPVNLPVDEFSE